VVLHDVADRPGLVVKMAASGDAELLGHGDLNALDVIAVPDRFQKGVGEAEKEQILHGFFAEVMVDAKDRRFWKNGV
jgi:hypothetical protein